MANKLLFSVNDNEIYDAYMSAPSHFTEKVLLEEGRRRSILYSKHEDRTTLAKKLSRLVYGHRELQPIERYFSQISRGDRAAAIKIQLALSQDELAAATDELAQVAEGGDQYTGYKDGSDFVFNAQYTETDFSRNRFRQRQQKEAMVRFEIGTNETTVTLPATEKAREIVAAIRNKIEEKRKAELPVQEVDLSGLSSTARTQFFTSLVSEFPNATLNDVLRVRLQAANSEPATQESATDEEAESDDTLNIDITRAEEVVAGILKGATLSGQDLFGTSVFQDLRRRGFFITSITWRSRLAEVGNPIAEFSAGFEDPEVCSRFSFSVTTWKVRGSTGEYNQSFVGIPAPKQAELGRTLQRFAMLKMNELTVQSSSSAATSEETEAGSEPN